MVFIVGTCDSDALHALEKLFGGSHTCTYTCPDNDKKPMKDPQFIPRSNGCGTHGITLNVSSYPGFEQCCNTHDKCYDTCNKDRNKCDKNFKSCLVAKCHHNAVTKVHDEKMAKTCKQLVKMMSFAVRSFGCSAYKEAQEHACLCKKTR